MTGASAGAGIPDPSGYAWSASQGTLSAADGRNVTLTLAPGFAGDVQVSVAVTKQEGCSDRAEQTLTVHAGPDVVADCGAHLDRQWPEQGIASVS